MKVRLALFGLALASAGFADTLVLRSGRVVAGNFMGATPRQIRMDVGERVETFDVSEIASITFDDPAAQAAASRRGSELPAGTRFVIRMIDGVDSAHDRVGQTFRASLDEPVYVNREPVIPRGSNAIVMLVDSQESGKALHLASVQVGERLIDINTQTVTAVSRSRAGKTATMGVNEHVVAKGQQVHMPAETRLTFTLDVSIRL